MRDKNRVSLALTIGAVLGLVSTSADAKFSPADIDRVNQKLQQFKTDPRSVMTEQLEKRTFKGPERPLETPKDKEGEQVADQYRDEEVRGKFMVQMEDGKEHPLMDLVNQSGQSIIEGRVKKDRFNQPENMMDRGQALLKKLKDMKQDGQVNVDPWSDYYWPIYQGILGARYNQDDWQAANKSKVLDWPKYSKLNSNPAFEEINASSYDKLSPGEKYSLLIGDYDFAMVERHAEQADYYQTTNGKVEPWMGICHGWAPAAFVSQLPRPRTFIDVRGLPHPDSDSALGPKIRFYPSDLKALGTLLWANLAPRSMFIGNRCNKKEAEDQIATNKKTGRPKDAACADVNPAAWHQVVTTKVGRDGQTFIMDATFDYEVWNQPIHSYDYAYFDPREMVYVDTLEEATAPMSEFKKTDPFFEDGYRDGSIRAAGGINKLSVVGIVMNVRYTVETLPTDEETDSEDYDAIKEVTYIYDLEVDSKGNLLGGEWYTNQHPDFLWAPQKDAKAYHPAEWDEARRNGKLSLKFGDDDVVEALPYNWAELAQDIVFESNNGDPLGMIVEELFAAAYVKDQKENPRSSSGAQPLQDK